MRASKFSEAQVAFVLKQAQDGTPIGEPCGRQSRLILGRYVFAVHSAAASATIRCNRSSIDVSTDSRTP